MSDLLDIDLFVEDHAHEAFLNVLVRRVAAQEKREIELRVRSGRGGHGRALKELSIYQQAIEKATGGIGTPGLLVICIDANCTKFNKAYHNICQCVSETFRSRTVIACPDPHIERWYMADPDTFVSVIGMRPASGKRKCARDRYKSILANAIISAGHPPTLGGIEFAKEIVQEMDLYRAGKNEPSLNKFISSLCGALRQYGS
jgi:hypothetical protein